MCHESVPDKIARICLEGAFIKDTDQRGLVKNAQTLIALEGCFIECASRTMRGVLPELAPQVIIVDRLYDLNTNLFGIDEMAEEEIKMYALTVAREVVKGL